MILPNLSIASAIKFTKMQGAGNDFIVLDDLLYPSSDDFDFPAAAISWCARRYSIGADGLLLLTHPESPSRLGNAQVRMRMWNPDGTEDMCGNGLRCVARLAYLHDHAPSLTFTVQTIAGLRDVEVNPDGKVRVEMGEPVFEMAAIPMQMPSQNIQKEFPSSSVDYTLVVSNHPISHVTSLSTGSTHTVIFVDSPLDDETFLTLSPQIEHHPYFPARTSVLWAQVKDRHRLELRIWERGVGETLACGTGACAAAVAAQVTGRCEAGVDVQSRGGTLFIEWRPDQQIQMTGPAQVVFEGRISGW